MTDAKKVKTLVITPHHGSMIKPGELIDIVEMTPLTLADRRTYNLLVANAFQKIGQPGVEHVIGLAELRGSHKGNERLADTVRRLMAAIVEVRVDGKTTTKRVQLLGGNDMDEDEETGVLRYTFDPKLVSILQNSTTFGQLRKEVMFAFESKYALALYEMGEKRRHLSYKFSEDFTVDEIRGLLGVPKGKLATFGNLNEFALKPAVKEVNTLADFYIQLDPLRSGRKVVGVQMSWGRKSPEQLRDALEEVRRHRAGRKARIEGAVERLANERGAELRKELGDTLGIPTTSATADLSQELDDEIVY